jgi:hypothetical protein
MADNFNHFDKVIDAIVPACSIAVTGTAKDIAATYKANAPRDTGFTADSAYITTSKESTYGQATPTRPGAYLLPEVEKPADELTAYAAVGANSAIYPELGTTRQSAQPAFYPAVEQAKTTFDNLLRVAAQQIEDAGK